MFAGVGSIAGIVGGREMVRWGGGLGEKDGRWYCERVWDCD